MNRGSIVKKYGNVGEGEVVLFGRFGQGRFSLVANGGCVGEVKRIREVGRSRVVGRKRSTPPRQ